MTTDGKKDDRHAVLYGPLVEKALHGSDRFSMILRNGIQYHTCLKSTLTLLEEKTRLIRFYLGNNHTVISFAASEAHDEACEIILDLKWRIHELN